MPRATVSTGLDLYYEVHGNGPPLLLISGTGHDHTFWAHQLPSFQREFRCIVFDNRGTGNSAVPPSGYSLADMADDAEGLLEAIGVGKAHVMGFSMGGHIAQELCLRHPRRGLSLGLHHTWARGCPALDSFQRARIRAAEKGDRETLADLTIQGLFSHGYIDTHWAEIEAKREWLVQRSPSHAGWLGQLWADLGANTLDRLHHIRVPTLITVSKGDLIVPPHHGRELNERIGGSRLVTFEDTGHLTLVEEPDKFAQVCMEFLRVVRNRIGRDARVSRGPGIHGAAAAASRGPKGRGGRR